MWTQQSASDVHVVQSVAAAVFRHALDGLEQNLHRINQDLQCKMNSLKLDEDCMKSRAKLGSGRPYVDRNMTLTGITRQKSAVIA